MHKIKAKFEMSWECWPMKYIVRHYKLNNATQETKDKQYMNFLQ